MTESAGPYVVSGEPLAPTYPQNWTYGNPSVSNDSKFPFTVETELYKHFRDGTDSVQSFFSVEAESKAPIVLSGGGMLTNAVLRYCGDLRDRDDLGLRHCPVRKRAAQTKHHGRPHFCGYRRGRKH